MCNDAKIREKQFKKKEEQQDAIPEKNELIRGILEDLKRQQQEQQTHQQEQQQQQQQQDDSTITNSNSCSISNSNNNSNSLCRSNKLAETWNALGLTRLYIQHDVTEAMKCFEKALDINVNVSSTSIATAVTLNDLACCYEKLNKKEKALNLYKEAIQILEEQNVSESHPALASGRRSYQRLELIRKK